MTRRADVVVVGGGVIGCAIARQLVVRGIDGVVLVEREPDVGEGASKANSAIVHTGFDAKPRTIESAMLRRAAALWPELIESLGVPFLQVGALMLARSADEATRLRTDIQPVAEAHGVSTESLDVDEVRAIAPYVTDAAVAGLLIPGEAIIDPFWLTRAYAEAAMTGGAMVLRGTAVTSLVIDEDGVEVGLSDGERIRADQVIDAAGLRADDVARLAGDDEPAITPRRGQFLVSEETFGVDRIVLPVPGPMGKGMLVTPIVFGGILLGPTATDGTDKDDRAVRPDDADAIRAATTALVPALLDAVPVRAFVGLRPVAASGDFIVRASTVGDRLWLACGIRSTGISVSPAIAERVVDDVLAARGWSAVPRSVAPPAFELPEAPGAVACLCRGVSRGELIEACRRPLAPTTLDGVKRRGGAMFGDCQGNLCTVEVARVLAAEAGVPITAIEKGSAGSWVFAPASDPGVAAAAQAAAPAATATGLDLAPAAHSDLVVIGLGHAGMAALAEARRLGLGVVGLDRSIHGTAVGLLPDDDAWAVELQTEQGTTTLATRAVLLATGGYVEPREQRAIAGPRPAGIVTSDLVDAALAAGLLPGRRAVLVGSGTLAERTASAMDAAGATVVARVSDAPIEVRGLVRLEAVRTADGWIDADTLVLADRLLPQPFLLRSLGLVDGRAGSAAAAAPDGRLPMDGLWAAGCCVTADPEHVACAASGRQVAEAIAISLLTSTL